MPPLLNLFRRRVKRKRSNQVSSVQEYNALVIELVIAVGMTKGIREKQERVWEHRITVLNRGFLAAITQLTMLMENDPDPLPHFDAVIGLILGEAQSILLHTPTNESGYTGLCLAMLLGGDEEYAIQMTKHFGELLGQTEMIANELERIAREFEVRGLKEEGAAIRERAAGLQESLPPNVESILIEIDRATSITEMPHRVELCRQALELVQREQYPDVWAALQVYLGISLDQNPQGNREENIEQAIEAYIAALEVYTRDAFPVDWAETQSNLGLAFAHRILGERGENIERAIEAYRRSLDVLTHEKKPEDCAQIISNLACAYIMRIHGDPAENTEQAIGLFRQAIEPMKHNPSSELYNQIMINLGNAYQSRSRGDFAENIDRSIQILEQALKVATVATMPLEWASAKMNLGNAYTIRIRGNRAENIERAIEAYRQALTVRDRETLPREWAKIMHNLAHVYCERIYGNRAENIEQAIEFSQKALELRTHDPMEWSETLTLLGNAYCRRIRGNRADNIEQAIQHYRRALEVHTRAAFPVGWAQTMNNLANAYEMRVRGDRGKNLERAVEYYQAALEVLKPELLPDDHRRVQWGLGKVCFAAGLWPEAAAAYAGALVASELLYQVAATPEARQVQLREVQSIPARLAYALVKTSTVGDPSNPQKAITVLEENRARWLSEALASGTEKPPTVPEHVWEPFVAQRERIKELESEARLPAGIPGKREYLILSGELRAAREQLTGLIAAIRKHEPGFMPQPSFAEIRNAAQNAPIIYLAVTPAGSVALAVHGDRVETIWLNNLTQDTLREQILGPADERQLGGYLGAYSDWRTNPHNQAARRTWYDTLDRTTAWLWEVLMGPLAEALANTKTLRTVLIPEGLLGLLPLHAAWTKDPTMPTGRRYALDEVGFAYTPNARALLVSRETAGQVPPSGLLAVDEPQPVSAGPLPSSAWEVAAAGDHFPIEGRRILKGQVCTRSTVMDALPDHPVLHFSCHGLARLALPLESGLLLAQDELLTLRDILALRLESARLAVLSACETGISGPELPDEVISLPAGLVHAGVAGVVGSLWSVSDLSTAMLMARFYDLWRGEDLEPAEALHQAQIWLRDTTNGEKAAYFQQEMTRETMPETLKTRLPADVAAHISIQTLLHEDGRDARAFEHPFYWAPFYLTGV